MARWAIAIIPIIYLVFGHATAQDASLSGFKQRAEARAHFSRLPRFQNVKAKEHFIGNLLKTAQSVAQIAMGGNKAALQGQIPHIAQMQQVQQKQQNIVEPAMPTQAPVDVQSLAGDQESLEQQLQDAEKEGDKLELAINMLRDAAGVKEKKGVVFSSSVIQPNEVANAEVEKKAEAAAKPMKKYTAPVVVLLPPITAPFQKLEFARALACAGKETPEMKKSRNVKLNQMAQIKGKTEEAIKQEIEKTKTSLEKSKEEREKVHGELRKVEVEATEGGKVEPDIIFLKEDLKKKDEEIMILVNKLKALDSRLKTVRTHSAMTRKQSESENEGEKKAEKKKIGIFGKMKAKFSRKKEKETEGEEEEEM